MLDVSRQSLGLQEQVEGEHRCSWAWQQRPVWLLHCRPMHFLGLQWRWDTFLCSQVMPGQLTGLAGDCFSIVLVLSGGLCSGCSGRSLTCSGVAAVLTRMVCRFR